MTDQEKPAGILGDLPKPSADQKPPSPLPKLPVLGLDEKLPVLKPPEENSNSGGGRAE